MTKNHIDESIISYLPAGRSRLEVTAATPEEKPWGIDVSHYQGNIDWKKVKRTNCSFVFLKASESISSRDKNFARYRQGAQDAGIITGAYHFFRTKVSLDKQMDNFAKAIGDVQVGELPPVLDVEIPSQWKDIAVADRNELVLDYIEGIRSRLGRNIHPVIYLSPSFANDVLQNDPRLKNHPLWLAHYTTGDKPTVPKPWTAWTFWQWTERGHVDGITTYVDLNRFNGSKDRLNALLVKE